MKLADVIAVPSGYLVDVFRDFGLAARSIYNFVDTNRYKFRLRQPLAPVFLSNRNHEPLYNVGCILRAFAQIQRAYPNARLVVAGDGSQREELERLAQELNLRDVSFIGRVEQSRMHELYEQADIYLNSSNIDNMPGSIIEAYAAGTPVVTTDAGGIPYILRDCETGLLVPRNDHEALARGALRLLEDAELAKRLALNARAACELYSWESVRAEWVGLYCGLAQDENQKTEIAAAGNDLQAGGAARGH